MKEYLTKDVAAKRSGRSVRRLLELAATGRIRKKIIQDPKNGNRPLALFHAADIAALVAGELPAAAPSTALQISGPVRPLAALPQPENSSVGQFSSRPWLTVAEAAEYSGLPARFLSQMVDQKRLPALDVGVRPGGRWRINRRDIDGIKA